MLLPSLSFWFIAGLIISSVVCTIAAKTAVYAVLALILSFIATAALAMIIGLEFIALSLILIYVGAIMVLFLFVIMMIDNNQSENERKKLPTKWYLVCAALGIMLIIIAIMASMDKSILKHNVLNEALQVSGASLKITGRTLYLQNQDTVIIMGIMLLIGTIGTVAMVIDFLKKPHHHSNINEQLKRDPHDSVQVVSVPFGQGVDY